MKLTRREFLSHGAVSAGAAAAGVALPRCAPDLGPAPYLDVDAPVDGQLRLRLDAMPELAREGGAVILRAPSLSPPVLLVRTGPEGFAAVGALCTHQGCPVGVEGGEIVCPCHLSRFAFDGAVRHPPARSALPSYGARLDAAAGEVVVDLRAGDPDFPSVVDGRVTLPFAEFPELAEAGGSVVGRPAGYGRPVIVVALPDGRHAAADAVCPHLQCTVGFSASAGEFLCPCHGSRFTTDGALLGGPATRGLLALETVTGADAVTVLVAAS
jgi:Rieske Fe-S protein